MNILLVLSDNNIASGAFNSGVILAKELVKKGNNVLVTVPKSGNGEELLKKNKVPYVKIKSFDWIIPNKNSLKCLIKGIIKRIYNVIPYYRYKRLIKKMNIDIVHNNTTYTYIAGKAAIAENVNLVWHLREFLEEDQNNKILFKKSGYKLINKSNKIICISSSIYNKYDKIFEKKKLEVIYNGIDEKKYFIPNHIILKNKCVNLLCVGMIKEKKGQLELCEAIGILLNKYKYNIKLTLVGDYDKYIKNKIDEICDKYNIHEVINLTGRQPDVLTFYSKADIAFMCSTSEAFGRVTVEGMFSGALVIGKNCAATSEIINDGVTGILYNDLNDLVEKIKSAIDDKKNSQKIAKQGQLFAKETYTSENNSNRIIELYNNLINKK